ncbi:unnamed protein product [Rhizophagus irregularis]|nr:unnamed protein product [Rhizophagus irregularis]
MKYSSLESSQQDESNGSSDFQRSEKGELRFVLGVSSVFRRTEKTKIRFGWASEEQKTQRFVRTVSDGFRRTEKGEPLLRFISGGLLNNGKEQDSLGGFPKGTEKGTKIRSRWGFLEE